MTSARHWTNLVKALPKGLSALQASRRLRRNYNTTRYWLVRRGYHRKDGRRVPWSPSRRKKTSVVDPIKVDWTMSDIEIASLWGVSRQRINQIRKNGYEHDKKAKAL